MHQTAAYLDDAGQSDLESLNLNFFYRLQQATPDFDRFVHDFQNDIESLSLPQESKAERDRPITRSMLGRRPAVPVWASRFHVRF